jgi:hypothetical protein
MKSRRLQFVRRANSTRLKFIRRLRHRGFDHADAQDFGCYAEGHFPVLCRYVKGALGGS